MIDPANTPTDLPSLTVSRRGEGTPFRNGVLTRSHTKMSPQAWAWAFYDWSNSAFPTVVSTFIIAPYFAEGIATNPTASQAQWGWMQAIAAVAIGMLSPVLGAVADASGRRRLMLTTCMLITAGATALIWFARPNPAFTLWVLTCVGVGTVTFELGTVFYNAMLPQVAPRERFGRVSGVAWGLGYAGGLTCLLIAFVLLVRPNPSPFGFDRGEAEHLRATALLVAMWTLVFGLPVVMLLPRQSTPRQGWLHAAHEGLRDVRMLMMDLPRNPTLTRFLLARLFYTDGLDTLFAFGAIYAAGVFGMNAEEVLLFGIALNVTAGLGAVGFGLLDDRIGSKRMVMVALLALIALGAGLLLAQEEETFWILALLLGCFAGPAQSASRTLMARLSPPQEETAHFGLFALSGRVTGFVGPAVLAAATTASGSQRIGMATVLLFLGSGAAILATVKEPARSQG